MPGERIGNSNQYLTISGVVSAPAYSWASDNDTGLYRIGANNIGIAANGTKVLDISNTAVTITPATTLSAALTYGGVTLSNAVTGTGNMVLSASPTLTGTITLPGSTVVSSGGLIGILGAVNAGAGLTTNSTGIYLNALESNTAFAGNPTTAIAITGPGAYWGIRNDASHNFILGMYNAGVEAKAIQVAQAGGVTLAYALTYGGVTLSNSVTGTGSMVLSASPTFTGTAFGAGFAATLGNARNYEFGAYATGSTKSGYQAGNSNTGFGAASGAFFGVDTVGNSTIDYASSLPLLIKYTGTEVARFGTDGSFLVGKTARAIATAGFQVDSTGETGITVNGSESLILTRLSSTGDLARFRATDASTLIGSIANVANTSIAYNTTSDARLKNVLAEQRDFRSIIGGLWFGDVEFKANPGTPIMTCLAQQANPLFPQAIRVGATEDEMWQADYSQFAPLALWGVKDLYTENELLKARVAALEERLH